MIGWLQDIDGWVNPVWAAIATYWDEQDSADERIERAWLYRFPDPPVQKRRRWTPRLLAEHYPFTQPIDVCQRCGRWTGDWDVAWQLDHIVELQYGGLDHPSNLVRLCVPCHSRKPHPPETAWGDPEAMRQFIVAWVRRGPAAGRPEPFDWSRWHGDG